MTCFDPFFLFCPERSGGNTAAAEEHRKLLSVSSLSYVWFSTLTRFTLLTVADTSMHGEEPDFYGGKTDD